MTELNPKMAGSYAGNSHNTKHNNMENNCNSALKTTNKFSQLVNKKYMFSMPQTVMKTVSKFMEMTNADNGEHQFHKCFNIKKINQKQLGKP